MGKLCCSKRCAQQYNSLQGNPKRTLTKTCEGCGRPFQANFKTQRFCSMACVSRKGVESLRRPEVRERMRLSHVGKKQPHKDSTKAAIRAGVLRSIAARRAQAEIPQLSTPLT